MAEIRSAEFVYRDPWLKPTQQRLEDLRDGKRKVAYFYEKPDSSTFRYRCHAMAQAITENIPDVGAACFWNEDGDALLEAVKIADVLVVSRARYTWQLEQLITVARDWGASVYFDVDDLVVAPARVTDLLQGISHISPGIGLEMEQTYDGWFASVSRLRATMDLTDGVIVTNDFLREQIAELTPLPVHVIPNFMSTEQVNFSRSLFAQKRSQGFAPQGTTHIGYFSGSPTHAQDFAVAAQALKEVLVRRPTVRLRLVGRLDLSQSPLASLSSQIDRHSTVDYLNLQRLIAATEINIIPSQNTVFHNCKSELKYFDAAAVGVPSLATPTFPFRHAIQDGDNGRLVPDGSWQAALLETVDKYQELAVPLGIRAYEQAMDFYVGATQAERICSVLGLGS